MQNTFRSTHVLPPSFTLILILTLALTPTRPDRLGRWVSSRSKGDSWGLGLRVEKDLGRGCTPAGLSLRNDFHGSRNIHGKSSHFHESQSIASMGVNHLRQVVWEIVDLAAFRVGMFLLGPCCLIVS